MHARSSSPPQSGVGSSNLAAGICGAAAAALICAPLRTAFSLATSMRLGFAAIGVAWLVASSGIGLAGRRSHALGIACGAFSVAACLLGDVALPFVADAMHRHLPAMQVASGVARRPEAVLRVVGIPLMKPMSYLFYGIAAVCGYRYASRGART